MPELMRVSFRRLEDALRSHAMELCQGTTTRYIERFSCPPEMAAQVQTGVKFFHDLALVAAAMYPSSNSVRNAYIWATNGTLKQAGIDYPHHQVLIRGYFVTARQVIPETAENAETLNSLEQFMQQILQEVFENHR